MDLSVSAQPQVKVLILATSTEMFHVVTVDLAKSILADKIKLIADSLVNVAHPACHQDLPPKIILLPDFRRQRHGAGHCNTFRGHVAEQLFDGAIIFRETILLNDQYEIARGRLRTEVDVSGQADVLRILEITNAGRRILQRLRAAIHNDYFLRLQSLAVEPVDQPGQVAGISEDG